MRNSTTGNYLGDSITALDNWATLKPRSDRTEDGILKGTYSSAELMRLMTPLFNLTDLKDFSILLNSQA